MSLELGNLAVNDAEVLADSIPDCLTDFSTSHVGAVNCLAVCGDYICSAGVDAMIHVWSCRDLQFVAVLRGHRGSILCLLAIDKLLLSGARDNTIRWGGGGVCLPACLPACVYYFAAAPPVTCTSPSCPLSTASHPCLPSLPPTPTFHPCHPPLPPNPTSHPHHLPSLPPTPASHPYLPPLPPTSAAHPYLPPPPPTPASHPCLPSLPPTPFRVWDLELGMMMCRKTLVGHKNDVTHLSSIRLSPPGWQVPADTSSQQQVPADTSSVADVAGAAGDQGSSQPATGSLHSPSPPHRSSAAGDQGSSQLPTGSVRSPSPLHRSSAAGDQGSSQLPAGSVRSPSPFHRSSHASLVTSLPPVTVIASASADGTVRLW